MPERSKYLAPSRAVEYLKKNHSSALNSPASSKIYRGLRKMNKRFAYIRPSKTERVSKNTKNIYTALIDILPSWKEYPKRSRSIVCSSEEEYASGYSGPATKYYSGAASPGAVYLVLPKNGAKIGICPADDMWHSFPIVFNRWEVSSMAEFNDEFDDFFQIAYKEAFGKYFNSEIGEMKGEQLLDFLKRAENLPTNIVKRTNPHTYESPGRVQDILKDKFEAGISWIEYFDELLNPDENGFKLQTIEHYDPTESESEYEYSEIWTESDCLLIRLSDFNPQGDRIGSNYDNLNALVKKMSGQEHTFQ